MAYAWIIDRDHLAELERRATGKVSDDAKGVNGPGQAPFWMVEALVSARSAQGAEVYTFELYDDDGILYYTGRMITDEGPSEPACAGPLSDFGLGYAGCTSVRYPGHPDMDCS